MTLGADGSRPTLAETSADLGPIGGAKFKIKLDKSPRDIIKDGVSVVPDFTL